MPRKGTGAVTVLVLVSTGSKYEKKEISGISHFLEHMLFKGTKKRPDKLEIAESLDKIGGLYNAFTGEDYTGYFAKVASSQFDIALEWVSDIFLNSLLSSKEIQREKGVIIEEINMIYDNPMAHVEILWNKLLYGDQPAGWDIAGTKETVSNINRQKLQDYMKSQYAAKNTIVVIAGNIKQAEVINKVKKTFSSIRTSQSFEKAKVIEIQTQPGCLIHPRKTDQTHLVLGVRGYNVFHPQKYAQDILSVVLGGMMSSRLFMEVREKLGLAYYIRTEVDSNADTGSLMTRAGIENNNVEKAISVILKEYKKISSQPLPPPELKKAKEYIKGKTTLLLESSDALASFFGAQELLEKKMLTPSEIYAKLDKVSSNDVLKTARDIFRPQRLNLALIGPFENKNRFNKILTL